MAEEFYTVVVADDEPGLLEAVCSMIRWEEIGFRLVGSAGNGLDALQLVEQLQPDLLLTYAVSAAEPPYLAKLRELGVRPVVLHEHLESHPLARAEYVKLFGTLTGREALADSLFRAVRDQYL